MLSNEVSRYGTPVGMDSFEIGALWHVDESPAYDVHPHGSATPRFVVVRTLDGVGELTFLDGAVVSLGPDSLMVLRHGDLRRYRCAAERWHFWWMEGMCSAPDSLPLRSLMSVPQSAGEREEYQSCFSMLRSSSPNSRALASLHLRARIASLMDQAQRHAPPSRSPRDAIARAIAAMREHLGGARVEQLATAADMGPRRFRQVFREHTGSSPKQYYDSLRLEYAAGLLRNSSYTVAQIADRLGYSSAFHFSRSFGRAYGLPPTAYRMIILPSAEHPHPSPRTHDYQRP